MISLLTKDDAKFFLKKCYEHQHNTKNSYLETTYVVKNYNYNNQRALELINYIVSKNYATIFYSTKEHEYPEGLKITASGIDWIEDVRQSSTLIQNIHFQNNYGSVGNGNSVTINNSFSLKQFDEAVSKNLPLNSPYADEIQKLRVELENLQKSTDPIPQGKLHRFSKLLQEHSWLSGPVATVLLEKFVQFKGWLP